jgi:predicted aminopeptidase
MRLRKKQIQLATRERYYEALESQPALQPWQGFFEGSLNNAQLNTVADYNQWVPAFTSLIDQCDAQWPCFWKAVERLAELDSEARKAALAALQERYHGND